MADRVAAGCATHGGQARTVQLKLRYRDFRTITRARTLPEPTDLAAESRARRACDCSTPSTSATGIRLLGVAAQQLDAVDGQDDGAGSHDQTAARHRRSARSWSDATRRRAVERLDGRGTAAFGADAVGRRRRCSTAGADVEPDRGAG